MDTEFQTKMQELAGALEAFKAENPEKYAQLMEELSEHLSAINDILAKAS